MVTATPNTVIHPNCDAREAASVILASVKGSTTDSAITALARAYERRNTTLGRAVITHAGYQRYPIPEHFDAATATYTITLGRLV